MGVKLSLPGYLQHFIENKETVEVDGATVRQCLLNLALKYPAITPEIFDINGKLAVIILHGEMPVGDDTLNRPVKNEDSIILFPIIEGG